MKIKQIKEIFDNYVGVDIGSKKRSRKYADIRFMFMYACYKHSTDYVTLGNIGKAINRDHSTVIHGLNQFKHLIDNDTAFRDYYMQIEKIIEDSITKEDKKDFIYVDFSRKKLLYMYKDLLEKNRQLRFNLNMYRDTCNRQRNELKKRLQNK